MEGARQMFGDTFGIGIKPPQIGDIVNIVNVDANNPLADTERYKELTFMQGVDFIYNESFWLLRIRARYSRVAPESPLISNILGLNLSPPPQPLLVLSTVNPGDYFLWNDSLVQVIAVEGDVVIISNNDGKHANISLEEAKLFLHDYVS